MSADTFRIDAVSSTLRPPKNRNSTTRLFRSSNLASASSASSSATKFSTRLVGYDQRFIEGHAGGVAAALLRVLRARVVDEDATHHTSGHGEEMRAVLPRDRLPVDQTDIGFIDERRGLQAVPDALSRHAASRDLVQLLMNQRDQLLAGSHVAFAPSGEGAR